MTLLACTQSNLLGIAYSCNQNVVDRTVRTKVPHPSGIVPPRVHRPGPCPEQIPSLVLVLAAAHRAAVVPRCAARARQPAGASDEMGACSTRKPTLEHTAPVHTDTRNAALWPLESR